MAITQTTAETAAIGLIDPHTLVRSLSPELMLVDPELAERARELLREPHEANGKGVYMSALGTHEITAGMSLGLEPPLSPPVVRSPMGSAMPTGDGLAGLPTPPPAIRPPESAAPASTPAPAPAPQAEVPQQPEPAPVPAQPEPLQPDLAPPAMVPEPAQVLPEAPAVQPEPQPEPELPAMAPVEAPAEPVVDYFASETAEPVPPVPAPVEELTPIEPVELPQIQPVPVAAPAPAPVEEPVVELPTMAPAELEPEPAALMAPEPVELASPAPEPEQAPEHELIEVALPVVEQAPEHELIDLPLPVVESLMVTPEPAPAPASELEELFAPKRTDFRVVVRLKEGDGVEVGSFRDFGTAMEGAQEVIEQFSTASEGQWPFYAGRFIRPDLIVSVDVVEGDEN